MEKARRGVLLMIVAAVTCVVGGQAMAFDSVWNTGVDGSGNVLTSGSTDNHYTLEGTFSAIATDPHPWWVAAPAGSMWIAPTLSNVTDAPGVYTFEQRFNLTADDLEHSSFVLNGEWATDDGGKIFFNGVDTGISRVGMGFATLESFEISTGFKEGENVIRFEVTNNPPQDGPNPTALLVTNFGLTAYPVPVPGALLLAGLGSCVIGYVRRRGIL